MWKPTKKQHLANKKYVDENGGGSGSSVVLQAVFNNVAMALYFKPAPTDLTVKDIFNAQIEMNTFDPDTETSTVIGYRRVLECGLDEADLNVIHFSICFQGKIQSTTYNIATGKIARFGGVT